MALIICPECGKEFSDRAKECPQCACPIEYVLSVINEKQGEWAKRVVRKPLPIRVERYSEKNTQVGFDEVTVSMPKQTKGKKKGLAGKFDQVVKYVKAEGVENIIENALRTIDDSGKKLKDMSDEGREKLFEKCNCPHQLLVDMRHAGWSKEITVYKRDWSVAYKGEAYFRERLNNATLETPFGQEVISVNECDPNEYKWELFPSDRLKTRMEKAEIYLGNSKKTTISLVPYVKKETYKVSNYEWKIEVDLLNLNYDIFDVNHRNLAKVSAKWATKTDIYVIDFWDESLQKMLLAITLAMDICKSSYEPKTLREKMDW